MREKDLFLNEEEPHLKHTILPPNDLSETRSELPQFRQILLELISNFKINPSYLNYIQINNVKKKCIISVDNENLLQQVITVSYTHLTLPTKRIV